MFKFIDGVLHKQLDVAEMTIQEMVDFVGVYYSTASVMDIIKKVVPNFDILMNIYGNAMQGVAHLPEGKLREIMKQLIDYLKAAPQLSEPPEEYPV